MKPTIMCPRCGKGVTPEEVTIGVDLACSICDPRLETSTQQLKADLERVARFTKAGAGRVPRPRAHEGQ